MLKTKRLFIAINLPPEIRKELTGLMKQIKQSFPEPFRETAFKWVKPENLHITLVFLGNIREQEIEKIERKLGEVVSAFEPFSLTLSRICYGPIEKLPPGLIWVEGKKEKKLEMIVEQIKKEMANSGFLRIIETHHFKPHITLARIRRWQWRQMDSEEQADIEQEVNISFHVITVDLMESRLRRSGPEYYLIKRFFLRKTAC